MKRLTSPAFIRFLVICALFIAGANKGAYAYHNQRSHQTSPFESGRLLLKHSPLLGFDVTLTVRIDGRVAGAIAKGHTFRGYIPPGRHLVTVLRNGREWDAWRMNVYVRPGQTYAYTVTYRVNQIVLNPVRRYR